MIGRVVSAKLKNTATVLIERTVMHPLYKKTFIRSKKYLVDDSLGVKLGDMVEIVKCKPISKNKHWKITKVVGADYAEVAKVDLKKEAEEIIAEVMPEEKEKEIEKPDAEPEKTEKDVEEKPEKISVEKPKKRVVKKKETK